MTIRLDYANATRHGGLRAYQLPDGTRVIEVPPSRAPVASLGVRALAGVVAALSVPIGFILAERGLGMGSGLVLVGIVAMGFVAWSTLAAPVRRPAQTRLRVEWRAGVVTLSGPELGPAVLRFNVGEVDDVKLRLDGGLEGATPLMSLLLYPRGGEPLPLLGEQDPADLLWLAGELRTMLGLPSRAQAWAAWFRRRAPDRGPEAAPVIAPAVPPPEAGPRPVLPVLDYATPAGAGWRGRGAEFRADRLRFWFPPVGPPRPTDQAPGAFIDLSVSELTVVTPEAVRRWPCERLYGVFVGAASQWAPLGLCVFAADGVTRVLEDTDPAALRAAVRLLNKALGTAGSVYSTESV